MERSVNYPCANVQRKDMEKSLNVGGGNLWKGLFTTDCPDLHRLNALQN
jgi:hypothetical protein